MLSQISISFVSLIAGCLLGNYLALGREKRKRRNSVREPIWILVESSWRKSNKALLPKLPSDEMVNNYRAHVSQEEARKLDDSITAIKALKRQCIPNGMGRHSIPPGSRDQADKLVLALLSTTRVR